jgi:tetrahydromethanopterin S-methyltransferase subunit G
MNTKQILYLAIGTSIGSSLGVVYGVVLRILQWV